MSKPAAPARPEVTVAGAAALRISWVIAESDPEVTASTVKVRIAGSQRWQNYDHGSGRLVPKGGATVPAPTCEVSVDGLEEGIQYEAIVAVMNREGWGDVSPPSEPMHFGELKPREKPPAPAPPKLVAIGPGKLRCSWSVPRTCPPVEAVQVQVTDMGRDVKMLVEASTGKLVSTGRTSFGPSRAEVTITGVEDGTEYVAAVCCRNAEGFGEYSIPSDSVALVDPKAMTSGMELVVHEGPTEVPTMEPLGDGQMKVRWLLPEDAKSTMVKLRRVGDNNWYLCGGTAIPAPAADTVANGLEEGIEYEAMVAFLINGRWCNESPVSRPACIGELKQPGLPETPKEPRLFIVDQAQCHMRVKWQLFTAVPPLTGIIVKFRPLGARAWQYVNATTKQVVEKESDPVPAPSTEVDVLGLRQGVRYEAAVAFRNKMGTGPTSPPSEIVCVGRPAPRLVQCTYCFADYDLQHAELTKSPESFWCPPCRFRQMDPFNAVIEPYGLLMCHVPMRNTIAFSLDLPELKSWRKDDHDVYMRMVKLNNENSAQVWPRKLSFEANGHEVFSIQEPEDGHVRRDVPKNIAPGLRPGMNTITIRIEDDYIPGYAMALVRTRTRTAQQIGTETPVCGEEAALARVMTLLAPSWSTEARPEEEEEEEITCVISNKLKLRCPLSFERVVIPVRGEQCMHLQCFGLGAYLESNMKMRALNNRWTCPVCGNGLKPRDLRIDGYVERVLSETPPHIEEVLIMQDGSYRCIEEEPEKAAEVREPEASAAAAARPAAVAAEREEEGTIVDEVPTVIEEEARSEKRRLPASVPAAPLTKRQRRRQKLLTVGQGSENDTD